MLAELRQRLQALQRPTGLEGGQGCLPLGIATIDAVLGGGLLRGALHEIAAPGEAHLAAAAGFAVGVAALASSPLPLGEVGARSTPGEGLRSIESHLPPEREFGRIRRTVEKQKNGYFVWLIEDMALAENGAPYGPGLIDMALAPERLLTVTAAQRRDLLWAMEEALRCRAVTAVIGELRHGAIDMVAVRRLSLAAAESGALALLLRVSPAEDASTAATRWIVGASPSPGGGGSPSEARWGGVTNKRRSSPPGVLTHADLPPPGGGEEESRSRFAAQLVRNRRGPLGAWILEWSDRDERFALATHAQPVATPALDRPYRQPRPSKVA